MEPHDAPDAAAARECLLCSWLNSHDPLRSQRNDTFEDISRYASTLWEVFKKLGKRPDVEHIVANRIDGLRSQGLSRNDALERLLNELPPGYPDEVASDRDRITRLVEKWWGPHVDAWQEERTARHKSETQKRRAMEKEKLEQFLASDRPMPYVRVAIEFASALVVDDFAKAEGLLSPELRRELTEEGLRTKFYGMFRGHSEGEAQAVHFDEEFSMQEWPDKRPGDVGWAYVGIEGDDFLEAVDVVVASYEGQLLIREIRWGRP